MMSFLPEGSAGWLLEAAARTIVMAGVVGLGLKLLRADNPHTQLVAWRGVLVAALVMPALMPVMILKVLPGPAMRAPLTLLPSDAGNATQIFEDVAEGAVNAAAFDWHQVLLPLYGVVAMVLLVRLAVGGVLTLRLRDAAVALRTDWTMGRDVRVSARLPAPVTVGATILLPADHWAWPAEKRAAVMAHESAHVARSDYHVQLLAGVYRALFWFSPLAWWLHDKLADLAELASDAEAATVLERSSYAEILLDFAARPPGIAAVGMARQETVERRIDRILGAHALPVRLPLSPTRLITGAVAVLAMASAASLAQGPMVQMPLPPRAATALQTPKLVVLPAPNQTTVPVIDITPDMDVKDVVRQIELQQRAAQQAQSRLRVKEAPHAGSNESAGTRAALPSTKVKETLTVSGFTGVSLAAVFGTVKIAVGVAPSLVLEGDPAALRQVRSEVRHGTLVIDHAQQSAPAQIDWQGLGSVTAIVTVTELKGVWLSGVGGVQVTGLDGCDTQMQLSGSGVIEASGKLDKLDLKISGAGKANMPNLVVAEADVSISGSGDATVQPRDRLSVDISGAARVHYVGQPQVIRTSISGYGTVHAQ